MVADDDKRDLTPITVNEVMAEYYDWVKEHRKSAATTATTINAHIKPKLGNRLGSVPDGYIEVIGNPVFASAPARIRGK